MSEIGQIIEQLHAAAARIDEITGMVQAAAGRIDHMRQNLARVLADSQSPEVHHAHVVTAYTIEATSTALHALQEAAAVARHRAATL